MYKYKDERIPIKVLCPTKKKSIQYVRGKEHNFNVNISKHKQILESTLFMLPMKF